MPRTARSHRRTAAATLVAAELLAAPAACAGSGGTADPGAAAPSGDLSDATSQAVAEAQRRADAALDTLLAVYWRAGDDYLAQDDSPSSGPTHYWKFAQALDTVLDGVERTGGARYADWVGRLYDAQDRRGWTSDWFDDEAWMGIALLRAHDLLGDPRTLDHAVALANDIAANASDGSCCGTTPGGLWWDRAHTQKATASNAGAALLAARLAERTGDGRWLSFAQATYGWWLANMVDSSGQVADHEDASGARTWWRFTYNEGTMIGAAVALHHATGDGRYLDDARRIAAFVVAHETRPTSQGAVLFDGDSCSGDCDQFKGIAERYLSALEAADPGVPGVAALLSADASAVWSLARDPASGLFAVDWGGPSASHATLSAQSSAGTALALDAMALAAGGRAGP